MDNNDEYNRLNKVTHTLDYVEDSNHTESYSETNKSLKAILWTDWEKRLAVILLILGLGILLTGCNTDTSFGQYPQIKGIPQCRDITTWAITGDGRPIPEVIHQCL